MNDYSLYKIYEYIYKIYSYINGKTIIKIM